jgi:hypothetical protein
MPIIRRRVGPAGRDPCERNGIFGSATTLPSQAECHERQYAEELDRHALLQANPTRNRQADVPAPLRRVAATIEDLGEVQVLDIVMHTEVTENGDRYSLTVDFDNGQDDGASSRGTNLASSLQRPHNRLRSRFRSANNIRFSED